MVGTPIAAGLQKLFEQIAVGAVHLDAVEAGFPGVARGLPVGVDNAGNLAGLQGAGCFVRYRLA